MPPNINDLAAEVKRLRKQVNGESSSESESSDETSSDEDLKDAKMEPPKTTFSGSGNKEKTYREWRSVKAVHEKWYEIRENLAKSGVLAGLYLDAIQEPARGKMMRELKRTQKRATVPRYMKILDSLYTEDSAISLDQWDKKLARFKRLPNQTLTAYLEFWDDQLLAAEECGYEKSKTEPFRLIRACDLREETREALMLDLQRRGQSEDPSYKLVRKLLGEIGRSKRQFEDKKGGGKGNRRNEERNEGGGEHKERSAHAAFVAGVGFAGGGGKAKGKGKGNKTPGVQRTIDKGFNEWSRTGKVQPKGAQKGAGGQKPKKQVPCRFFAAGTCTQGANCQWGHFGGGGSGNQGGGNGQKKPGDWTCPKCKANNFASRQTCFIKECGCKRPDGI